MDMYPYVETLKVGTAYAVLLYVWPCILFRGVLRKKGLTFRFLFCSIVQPVLLSTVVLTLGLFHILNVWIVRALFWGALAVSLLRPFWGTTRQGRASARLPIRALVTGSYGWKLYFSRIKDMLMHWGKKVWQQYRKRSVEYLVLTAILLFGMAFFLNGAFHDWSFGCYDQYTHYEWTNALVKGEIFAAGIYPEGMHCFLYALHVLFGVKLYSCVLFLAGIHNSSVFLVAAYCLFKELFRSRHVPLFVLTAWLTFDGVSSVMLRPMTRMSWTLPQEFALHLVFLCPLLLLRYFRKQDRHENWYRDEDLLLLMVGVASAVSTHFYVLILAFCSCCAVAVVHHRECWPVKRLRRPVCAVLYGLELGALPMLAACAMGKKLEGSLWWGFNTFRGTSSESSVKLTDPVAASDLMERNPLKTLYENGYLHLFGESVATLLILLTLLALVYVYARWRGKFQKVTLPAGTEEGYLTLIAALTIFVFLYAMPSMGLPELVAIDRIPGIIQIFAIGAIGILADLLVLWAGSQEEMLPRRWMALGCLILYVAAYLTDFHQCTYWWLRRFNAAVTVTEQIMDRYPEGTYKIVSMWDEAYQAGEEGHEELLTFLENTERDAYSIPVEYIFVYVEKFALLQGQMHFTTAPRWLARENKDAYEGRWDQSQCPYLLYWGISQDWAERELSYYPSLVETYYDIENRTILCSKAYRWYQEFSAAHPAETNVYYEDSEFVCYMIHQDQNSPLELAMEGGDGR